MSTQIVNQAAWQTGPYVKSLSVGPGPDQNNPASDEVVIKVEYVAINPSEWKVGLHQAPGKAMRLNCPSSKT